MYKTIILFFSFLCLLVQHTTASYCYPDYCQNVTKLEELALPIPGFQCLLTRVQKGESCAELNLAVNESESTTSDVPIFTLHAYIKTFQNRQRATAFNLSISNANFQRLTTRYQYIVDKNRSACRHVQLYDNSSHPAPRDLYVSCPFSDAKIEGLPYRFEYLAIGDNYIYNRKYIFYVPKHENIDSTVDINTYTPFIYVDASDSSNLTLYVQPLPQKYNVTNYRVWLVDSETETAVVATVLNANQRKEHIRHSFTPFDGIYYVKVAALHPDCDEQGCRNISSPHIRIKRTIDSLLIMIISVVWIVPVTIYAMYYFYKLYRKKALQKVRRRPNCLLMYTASHIKHVQIITELKRYLYKCGINPLAEINIRDLQTRDPGVWCLEMFKKADVVLVIASPPAIISSDVSIYRNVDKYLLRLVKENYPKKDKNYYTLYLPYCEPDAIPEEACLFPKFYLPKDLKKLVKAIHGYGYYRYWWPENRVLLETINFSTKSIKNEIAEEKEETEQKQNIKNNKNELGYLGFQWPLTQVQKGKSCTELNLVANEGESTTSYVPISLRRYTSIPILFCNKGINVDHEKKSSDFLSDVFDKSNEYCLQEVNSSIDPAQMVLLHNLQNLSENSNKLQKLKKTFNDCSSNESIPTSYYNDLHNLDL